MRILALRSLSYLDEAIEQVGAVPRVHIRVRKEFAQPVEYLVEVRQYVRPRNLTPRSRTQAGRSEAMGHISGGRCRRCRASQHSRSRRSRRSWRGYDRLQHNEPELCHSSRRVAFKALMFISHRHASDMAITSSDNHRGPFVMSKPTLIAGCGNARHPTIHMEHES